MSIAEWSRAAPPKIDRIGPDSAGIRLSPEEFDAIPRRDFDDEYRYELIDGVLIVSPMAGIQEMDPNEELGHLLRTYSETHPQGSALDATVMEHDLRVGRQRRRCDRAIWAGLGRLPEPKLDLPAIVVEFVSPGRAAWRRDHEQKRDEYLGVGIREYWVIDRFQRSLTAYRPDTPELVIAADGPYRTDLLPGFDLPLARLLATADRWGPR